MCVETWQSFYIHTHLVLLFHIHGRKHAHKKARGLLIIPHTVGFTFPHTDRSPRGKKRKERRSQFFLFLPCIQGQTSPPFKTQGTRHSTLLSFFTLSFHSFSFFTLLSYTTSSLLSFLSFPFVRIVETTPSTRMYEKRLKSLNFLVLEKRCF